MKNLNLLPILILLFILSSCHGVRPDGGEEGVIIKKPWFFGHGGVEKNSVETGLTWCVLSTSSVIFDLKPRIITEEFNDLITSDNVPVDFKSYVTVQIIKGETPILYEKFGVEWYYNNLKEPFRTLIRNYSKKQKLFELTTNADVLKAGEQSVFEDITKLVKDESIPVKILKVTIGKISPPEDVIKETTHTAAEKQRAKTNAERAIAELARKAAEQNSAKADKAYREEFGMSTDQYLKSRGLDIQEMQVKLAEKKENVTLIFNQGAIPMLPIK